MARLAEDIAGGLMVTMAWEKDLKHPEIGRVVQKYFQGVAWVPTENRMRILRLIENMTGRRHGGFNVYGGSANPVSYQVAFKTVRPEVSKGGCSGPSMLRYLSTNGQDMIPP